MVARVSKGKHGAPLLLASLAVVALLFDLWQSAAQRSGGQAWFDNIVCAAASPLQQVITVGVRRVETACTAIAHGRALADENVRLAARVAELEEALTRLEESRTEAEREQALRAAYPAGARRGRIAQVIGVASDGWSACLIIDQGRAQSVRCQDVAVGARGVVGQVYAVAGRSARVVPITDPASGVAVRLQRSRETGILKGLGDWKCELRYLGPEADVRAGDLLVTAGTGGVFPKGLRVGTVTSVTDDPYTPGKAARVEPSANLRRVEAVLLMRGLGEL